MSQSEFAKLPENLNRILKDRRITFSRLSTLSGVPKTTLHSWTTGTEPKITHLRKVAEVLAVSFYELAFGMPDPFEAKEEILKELFSGDVRISVHRIERRNVK
ncbi:MAG: helix-turn-helix transcriptional regulator [Bdellovibrionota bacterium]